MIEYFKYLLRTHWFNSFHDGLTFKGGNIRQWTSPLGGTWECEVIICTAPNNIHQIQMNILPFANIAVKYWEALNKEKHWIELEIYFRLTTKYKNFSKPLVTGHSMYCILGQK